MDLRKIKQLVKSINSDDIFSITMVQYLKYEIMSKSEMKTFVQQESEFFQFTAKDEYIEPICDMVASIHLQNGLPELSLLRSLVFRMELCFRKSLYQSLIECFDQIVIPVSLIDTSCHALQRTSQTRAVLFHHYLFLKFCYDLSECVLHAKIPQYTEKFVHVIRWSPQIMVCMSKTWYEEIWKNRKMRSYTSSSMPSSSSISSISSISSSSSRQRFTEPTVEPTESEPVSVVAGSETKMSPTLFQGLMQLAEKSWLANWHYASDDATEIWCNIRDTKKFYYVRNLLHIDWDDEDIQNEWNVEVESREQDGEIWFDSNIQTWWEKYAIFTIIENVQIHTNQIDHNTLISFLESDDQKDLHLENIIWPPNVTLKPTYYNCLGLQLTNWLYRQFKNLPPGWFIYDVVMPSSDDQKSGASVFFITDGPTSNRRKACKIRSVGTSAMEWVTAKHEYYMTHVASRIGLTGGKPRWFKHKSNRNIVMLVTDALDMSLKQFCTIMENNPPLRAAFQAPVFRGLEIMLDRMKSNFFVHGDMHSNNIMLGIRSPTENQWIIQLALIDFGRSMCMNVPETDESLVKLVRIDNDDPTLVLNKGEKRHVKEQWDQLRGDLARKLASGHKCKPLHEFPPQPIIRLILNTSLDERPIHNLSRDKYVDGYVTSGSKSSRRSSRSSSSSSHG